MKCGDLMKTHVITCRETDTVHWSAQLMRDWKIGFLPVVDAKKRLTGVLTDRDLAVRVLADDRPFFTEAAQIMSANPVVCRSDEALSVAEERMTGARKSRIPVVDESGGVIGVISLSDVAQAEGRRRAGEILQEVTRREAWPEPRPLPRKGAWNVI